MHFPEPPNWLGIMYLGKAGAWFLHGKHVTTSDTSIPLHDGKMGLYCSVDYIMEDTCKHLLQEKGSSCYNEKDKT